jgi:hypothetical protein
VLLNLNNHLLKVPMLQEMETITTYEPYLSK